MSQTLSPAHPNANLCQVFEANAWVELNKIRPVTRVLHLWIVTSKVHYFVLCILVTFIFWNIFLCEDSMAAVGHSPPIYKTSLGIREKKSFVLNTIS